MSTYDASLEVNGVTVYGSSESGWSSDEVEVFGQLKVDGSREFHTFTFSQDRPF